MSKELIYLGVDGESVRLALADLDDLTPRDVPVKKLPKADFTRLIAEKNLELVGYVNNPTNIENDTYIGIGTIALDSERWGGEFNRGVNYKAGVFISGSGKLRVFHPKFVETVQSCRRIIMRKDLRSVKAEVLENIDLTNTGDIYDEYVSTQKQRNSDAYLYQELLLYGLYGVTQKSSYGDTYYIYPTSPMCDENNPYEVRVPKLTLPYSNSRLGLNLKGINMHIEDLTCTSFYSLTVDTKDITVDRLHLNRSTHINILHGTNVRLGEVQKDLYAEELATGRSYISGLKEYPGNNAFLNAESLVLSSCFCDLNLIEGDIVIPGGVDISSSFNNTRINGKVIIGVDSTTQYSFNKTDCNGVEFKGTESPRKHGQEVHTSFKEGTIRGDIDLSRINSIVDSFTGRILGTVKLNPRLKELSGGCFGTYAGKDFTVNPVDRRFSAGLRNPEVKLTVIGDSGNFRRLDVAELTWITEAEELPSLMFEDTKNLMTNEVPSIKTLKDSSIDEYRGELLDLRLFPNLETIESKAIINTDDLIVAIVGGKTQLKPSSFTRCSKLAHIFIGDEVTGLTASAFNEVAPIVNIYYDKNKSVERLGRLPRFKLHPNSTPDSAKKIFDEIDEKYEAASVVAAFADIKGVNTNARADKVPAAQAVMLSLSDTGMSDVLSARYPVKPTCSKPASEVSWVSAVKFRKNLAEEKLDEVVRTLVALTTMHYPYCESVLQYQYTPVGEVIIESAKYSFIRSTFKYSGDDSYAYVVLDKETSTIIHAFTMGPRRDDISEIALYLPLHLENPTCSIMQYSEDVEMLGYSCREFTNEGFKEVQKAVTASWLPFGSFRIGSKYGIYGIDLYSGDYVVYPYSSKDGSGVRRGFNAHNSTWWTGRVQALGHILPNLRDTLQPQFVGKLDEVLAKIVTQETIPLVKDYDTGKIRIATELKSTTELLTILTKVTPSTNVTTDEITDLLLGTELYRRDNRVTTTYLYGSRTEKLHLSLSNGSITFYEVKYLHINLAQVVDSKGKTQWLVGVGKLTPIIDLLNNIVVSGGKAKDPAKYPEHYTISERYQNLEMLVLSVRDAEMYKLMGISNVNHELHLGISPVSYKACLYYKYLEAYSGEDTTVLFWFNSIQDAIKASAEIEFTPHSTTMASGGRSIVWRSFPSGVGKMYLHFISNTIKAIREGKPNGYILPGAHTNQTLFDLACKQPKVK